MNFEYLALMTPMLSSSLFLFFEKFFFMGKIKWSRIRTLSSLFIINTTFHIVISLFILVPMVTILAPFEIFSLATWQVPIWLSFAVSFLFLDFVYYASHRIHHQLPFFWKFHRLHHSDRNIDPLATVLHHPLEVFSAFTFSVFAAVLFDIPTIVLLTFGIVSSAHAAFTHLNHQIPDHIEKILKWFIITPNFHLIHHSENLKEGNSNFGTIFVFWDYLFSTNFKGKTNKPFFTGVDVTQSPRNDNLLEYIFNPLK